MQAIAKKTRHYYFFVLLIAGYYAAAFYPYELAIPVHVNNHAKIQEDGSLDLSQGGMILLPAPHGWLNSSLAISPTKFYLEALSLNSEQTGPARIASFSIDPYERNISIAQENSNLLVRLRRDELNPNGVPAFVIEDVFADSRWRTIEIQLAEDSFKVLVDGSLRLSEPLNTGYRSLWDEAYPVIFGNEATGDRPWFGYIRNFQVCALSECLEGSQPGQLQIPGGYWRGPTWQSVLDKQQYFATTPFDMFVNFLFFAPFGFLMATTRAPTFGIATALATAALISVSIEAVQFILASRVTSLVDLVLNVAGSGLGFLAGRHLVPLGWRSKLRATMGS
jgi:hypothetical protein